MIFNSGCALVWTDEMLLITAFKDYETVIGKSTSNKFNAEYKPFIEVETRP